MQLYQLKLWWLNSYKCITHVLYSFKIAIQEYCCLYSFLLSLNFLTVKDQILHSSSSLRIKFQVPIQNFTVSQRVQMICHVENKIMAINVELHPLNEAKSDSLMFLTNLKCLYMKFWQKKWSKREQQRKLGCNTPHLEWTNTSRARDVAFGN